VEEPEIRNRVLQDVIGLALQDGLKGRRLQVDGTYLPPDGSGSKTRSQAALLDKARRQGEGEPVIRPVAAP
jgi:hypothetical protein